jgi:IS5 family transposase
MVWRQTIELNQIIDRWSPRMRQERITQATIFEVFAEHEIGQELKGISQWLDEHRALLTLVVGDLRRQGLQQTGRQRKRCCAARCSSNTGN